MITWLLVEWKLVLIALLGLAIGVQQGRVDHAQAEASLRHRDLLETQAAYAQAAQQAEANRRAEEQRRDTENERNIEDARKKIDAAEAALAAARGAGVGLRNDLGRYVARARARPACPHPEPAGRSAGQPDTDPANLLAELYRRADSRATTLAEVADRLRIAGLACERFADTLSGSP